jgi:hypothetical protein
MTFNRTQHAAFYGGMVLFVVVLLQAVTAYGERNLKAQPNISGRYVSTTAPPGCPDRDRLVLDVQQSGIYLNVFLMMQQADSIQPTETNSEKHPTFTGTWQHPQVSLAGKTDVFAGCTTATAPGTAAIATLQGEVTAQPEGQFVGQLKLDNGALGNEPWQFQAQKQAKPKAEAGH